MNNAFVLDTDPVCIYLIGEFDEFSDEKILKTVFCKYLVYKIHFYCRGIIFL